jgi:hypothetical protein
MTSENVFYVIVIGASSGPGDNRCQGCARWTHRRGGGEALGRRRVPPLRVSRAKRKQAPADASGQLIKDAKD